MTLNRKMVCGAHPTKVFARKALMCQGEKGKKTGCGLRVTGCELRVWGDFGVESGYDEMKVLRGFE